MARAVNQTIAWFVALFLSLIVFGIGLAIVFSMKPKHQDDHGSAHEPDAAPAHDAHDSHKTDEHKAPTHPADSEAGHAKPKIEHEDPHAKDGGDEDKEITPASVKAKADGRSPEANPHH
ncbi:MAG TPA: hypothetical protein VE954_23910 [Oligoflexus sp.]|uniref:hypothetical protein n=1 Tax=Oligoflexus sp. TaxID=1971216 RepID=UPI002D408AC5|nr:hypothetical protein [Oligoflexus sp.]HYX36159.1 hypothetical protein [Oligoflexus sp.]